MKLFVDMDEVLADFRAGACKVHGWNPETIEEKTIQLGVWDMCAPTGITPSQFWKPITAASWQFWAELDPLPWFDELLALLQPYEWYVVSSPSYCPSCQYGKALWGTKYLGSKFVVERMFVNSSKHLFAPNENAVLIDDRQENCYKFIDHGGDAILFPSVGNTLYRQRDKPLKYVLNCLEQKTNQI